MLKDTTFYIKDKLYSDNLRQPQFLPYFNPMTLSGGKTYKGAASM